MDKEDLRILFAAFAMLKMSWHKGDEEADAKDCWLLADAMINTKDKTEPTSGIAAIKKPRRNK